MSSFNGLLLTKCNASLKHIGSKGKGVYVGTCDSIKEYLKFVNRNQKSVLKIENVV